MYKNINFYLPGLKQCWVIVFYLLVVGGLGMGTLLSIACKALGYDMAGLNPLVSYIVPLLPAFAYIFTRKPSVAAPVKVQGGRYGRLSPFILYPLLAATMLAIGFVSEPLSSWLPMPDSIKQVFEKILSNSGWAFATTVIAAPVLEEFLLRGVIERGLLRHTTPAKAILWSSFFFAVIHMNPWQAIGAFIAGAFLGWIYWRTHSLIACIFIHAVNNGTAYLIQILNPSLPPDSTYKDLLDIVSPHIYSTVFVIFVILLAALLHILNKNLPADAFKEQTT